MIDRYIKLRMDSTFKFKCTRQGKCCKGGPNVSLTVFDVIRIAKYLNKHWSDLIPTYIKVIIADMVPFLSLRGIRDECIFLRHNDDGTVFCEIYPVRPMRCRLYPLLPSAPGADYVYLDPKCPGIGSGPERRVPKEAFEKYYEEVKEHYKLIMKKVLDEGLEPRDALEEVLDELWEKYDERIEGYELPP